jgi:hypothetical protein
MTITGRLKFLLKCPPDYIFRNLTPFRRSSPRDISITSWIPLRFSFPEPLVHEILKKDGKSLLHLTSATPELLMLAILNSPDLIKYFPGSPEYIRRAASDLQKIRESPGNYQ